MNARQIQALVVASIAFGLVGAHKAAPLQDPNKFDLVCVGQQKAILLPGPSGSPIANPATQVRRVVIRIDLSNDMFCYDACNAVGKIYDVDPLKITLIHQYEDTPNVTENSGVPGITPMKTGKGADWTIDRVKGTTALAVYETLQDARIDDLNLAATCTKQPFSGFPAAQF